MRLTERDIEILRFINDFGFCEMVQIERRFLLKKPRNYEIMRRLLRNGFVNHRRIFFARHGIYYLSAKGALCTNLPPIDRVTIGQYEHQVSVINVYMKLRVLHPEAIWISERQLKHDKYFDGVGKRGHLSDGVLMFQDGKKIAVEVEISVKGKNRIDKILKGYAAQFELKEVWYFCLPGVLSVLMRAVVKMPFIKVFNIKEFLS
jgi:hypothetical protein